MAQEVYDLSVVEMYDLSLAELACVWVVGNCVNRRSGSLGMGWMVLDDCLTNGGMVVVPGLGG